MPDKKILIFGSKIPDIDNKQGANFIKLLKYLKNVAEISFLPLQTLFWEEKTISAMKNIGINIILKEKETKNVPFEKRLNELLSNGQYNYILFDSVYTAKYYIPFLTNNYPEIIYLMDARNSQFLMVLGFFKGYMDKVKKIKLMEKSKSTKMKEIPIYNYFDAVFVSNDFEKKSLTKEIPNVPVIDISQEHFEEDLEGHEAIKKLGDVSKRSIFKKDSESKVQKIFIPDDIDDKDGNIIRKVNRDLRQADKEFSLIVPEEAFFPPDFYQKIVFCINSHNLNSIVTPISNWLISPTVSSSLPHPDNTRDYSEFLRKHYLGNFGCWYELNRILEKTLLVRNEIFNDIGYLDQRFKTLKYGLMDLCYRIQQAGNKVIMDQETIVYTKTDHRNENNYSELDQRLLIEKWGRVAEDFLVQIFKDFSSCTA